MDLLACDVELDVITGILYVVHGQVIRAFVYLEMLHLCGRPHQMDILERGPVARLYHNRIDLLWHLQQSTWMAYKVCPGNRQAPRLRKSNGHCLITYQT